MQFFEIFGFSIYCFVYNISSVLVCSYKILNVHRYKVSIGETSSYIKIRVSEYEQSLRLHSCIFDLKGTDILAIHKTEEMTVSRNRQQKTSLSKKELYTNVVHITILLVK